VAPEFRPQCAPVGKIVVGGRSVLDGAIQFEPREPSPDDLLAITGAGGQRPEGERGARASGFRCAWFTAFCAAWPPAAASTTPRPNSAAITVLMFAPNNRLRFYLRQTLSSEMQELPHGLLLPGVQRGCSPLRQEDMNVCRADPVIPVACALQSFIRFCWELSAARLGAVSTIIASITKRNCRISFGLFPDSLLVYG